MYLGYSLNAQSQLHIGPDAEMTVTSGTQVVLCQTNFHTDGGVHAEEANFKWTGTELNGTSLITGGELVLLPNIALGPDDPLLQLNNDLEVNNNIVFAGGNLDLDNHRLTILYQQDGLQGEHPMSRITGGPFGVVETYASYPTGNQVDAANLGAELTVMSNPGFTRVERGHYRYFLPTGLAAARWYRFTPGNNYGLSASLKFNYFDEELGGLDESTMVVWRSDNLGASWTPVDVRARNTTENWVLINNQNSLSMYTLAPPMNSALVVAPDNSPETTADKAAQLTNTDKMISGMSIFPNPVGAIAQVRIQSPHSGPAQLNWYNQSGQLIHSEQHLLQAGDNQLRVDVEDWTPGSYFLHCDQIESSAIQMVKE